MSNYVQSTNFATKDALPSGDPLKIVKGTEINTEFANIAIAVATKADTASPTFTGTPSGVTQAFGNNATILATTAFVQAALQALHPVGSIYTSTTATNPGTTFGFGTWVAFGAGRMLLGDGGGFSAGSTGGAATTTLATANLPSHTHTATVSDPTHSHTFTNYSTGGGVATSPQIANSNTTFTQTTNAAATGITVSNANTGSGTAATTISPYLVVYIWNRTA